MEEILVSIYFQETNTTTRESENIFGPMSGHKKMCCANALNSKTFLITNPNFPQSITQQDECTYEIRKANKNICMLNLKFVYFWFGQSDSKNCSYGYLELDGKQFCGCHTDLKLSTVFDHSDVKIISLKTFEVEMLTDYSETGFVIEVTQEECFEKQSRISWPEKNIGALIQKGNLLKEKTEIWNQDRLSTVKPVIQRNFYYFDESTTDKMPFFPEDNEKRSYKDINRFETVTSNNDKSTCMQKITPSLIEKIISSTEICRKNENFENLLVFKKLSSYYPRSQCLELGYLRGFFRSPWYPFFYLSYLNQCYR